MLAKTLRLYRGIWMISQFESECLNDAWMMPEKKSIELHRPITICFDSLRVHCKGNKMVALNNRN